MSYCHEKFVYFGLRPWIVCMHHKLDKQVQCVSNLVFERPTTWSKFWQSLVWSLDLIANDEYLTPKIAWDQKLIVCCLGSLCEEKLFFINFFFWTNELHISQAFREHQACPIPTLYEPVANFCWKQVLSSFFMYFLKSSYMQPCGWKCLRAGGQGLRG
jgi:hypothetical protein